MKEKTEVTDRQLCPVDTNLLAFTLPYLRKSRMLKLQEMGAVRDSAHLKTNTDPFHMMEYWKPQHIALKGL